MGGVEKGCGSWWGKGFRSTDILISTVIVFNLCIIAGLGCYSSFSSWFPVAGGEERQLFLSFVVLNLLADTNLLCEGNEYPRYKFSWDKPICQRGARELSILRSEGEAASRSACSIWGSSPASWHVPIGHQLGLIQSWTAQCSSISGIFFLFLSSL